MALEQKLELLHSLQAGEPVELSVSEGIPTGARRRATNLSASCASRR
jgi:hypothetical protein